MKNRRASQLAGLLVFACFLNLGVIIDSLSFSEESLDASIQTVGAPEILLPNANFYNDFHISKSSATAWQCIQGNPGSIASFGGFNTLFWETNDTYLYWGNATGPGDTSTDWGIGKGIYKISDPIGDSEYWTLNISCWTAGLSFLSPTWTQIGTYALSSSGIWCAFNLGVGTTAGNASYLTHTQMHTEEAQDSWWWTNGAGTYDNPPNAWVRPEGGTGVWPVETHTLYNRPFTLEEVRNLVVILEVSFTADIFYHLSGYTAGAGLSIGIGGIMVTAIPVAYTPPDYTNSFVLWPENEAGTHCDNEDDIFKNESDSTDSDALTISINETVIDYDTYAWANWTSINLPIDSPGSQYAIFNLSDIDTESVSDSPDIAFYAYVFLVMQCDNQDYNTQLFVGYYDKSFWESYPRIDIHSSVHKEMTVRGISEEWANYSMGFVPVTYIPATKTVFGPFSYDDLNDMTIIVQIMYPYNYTESMDYWAGLGEIRIAQMGMFCVPYYYEGYADEDIIFTENTNAIIWLIVIFTPAIAFGIFVPKLGFMAGMALMLGVFGATQAGFFPIALMGFVALGVAIYKGR